VLLHSVLSARRAGRAVALAVGLSLAIAGVAAASNGNNGTVKVHDGATDDAPEIRNEPHVCTFHLHFFFADAGQAGDWRIEAHPPTDGATVLSGSYLTDAAGEDETVEMGLPVGHYKLYWEGRNDHNLKHKTFWVTCDNPPGPIGGGGGGGIGGGDEDPPPQTG
jgi:hypothetical protein